MAQATYDKNSDTFSLEAALTGTQAVAYIVRPNAVTMDAIRRLRLDPSLHRSYNSGEEQQGKPIPYPLPRGTISMHVRWAALSIQGSVAVMPMPSRRAKLWRQCASSTVVTQWHRGDQRRLGHAQAW